jgi:hypothetical protein
MSSVFCAKTIFDVITGNPNKGMLGIVNYKHTFQCIRQYNPQNGNECFFPARQSRAGTGDPPPGAEIDRDVLS